MILTNSIKRLKSWGYLQGLGFEPINFHFKNYYGIGAELKYLNCTITIEGKGNGYMLHGDFKEFPARQLKKQVDARIKEIESRFTKGFKEGVISKVFNHLYDCYEHGKYRICTNAAYQHGYKIGYETPPGDYEKGYYAAQSVKCGRASEIPKNASQLFIIGFNANLLNKEIYSHF